MLQRLLVRNFKQFDDVNIELGSNVVFIGPNNSGKTSALQALALWELGLKRWTVKRGSRPTPKQRAAVTLNRRDLLSLPVPETNLLWRNMHVRSATVAKGKRATENVRIDVAVEGVNDGVAWSCGLEFDYANSESLYCRPLNWTTDSAQVIPSQALGVRVAYLPPMSGLVANETRLDAGAIQVRLGEGRTAEVLRNLVHGLVEAPEGLTHWQELSTTVKDLFGVVLERPVYIPERGELTMSYKDRNNVRLDVSAGGRGFQQVVLLLSHILTCPGSVLLLDEPDAHLEILRQQQVYQVLTRFAAQKGSQVIAASHSEVILQEAAGTGVVIAFVGKPHRIDDRGSQLAKSLRTISSADYYRAESTGWVLYVEGSTYLAVLQGFARTLKHPAAADLERPFVHYVGNVVSKAKDHFFGLKEALPDLVGFVLTDAESNPQPSSTELQVHHWLRREIENYMCLPDVLEAHAASLASGRDVGPLFEGTEPLRYAEVMRGCIRARVPPAALEDLTDRWWLTTKATDDFLDVVFAEFFSKMKLPNLTRKADYHELAARVPRERIDDEVVQVLDAIHDVATRAKPRGDEGGT